MLELIIALLSGAAGGNIVGALAKNLSLGTLGNSLAGIGMLSVNAKHMGFDPACKCGTVLVARLRGARGRHEMRTKIFPDAFPVVQVVKVRVEFSLEVQRHASFVGPVGVAVETVFFQ